MNIQDIGFFISDTSNPSSEYFGSARIVVDHDLLMSMDETVWKVLGQNQIRFLLWYREQVLKCKLKPSVVFTLSERLIEPYDQEKICKELLDFLGSDTVEDPDLF